VNWLITGNTSATYKGQPFATAGDVVGPLDKVGEVFLDPEFLDLFSTRGFTYCFFMIAGPIGLLSFSILGSWRRQ
jgi:hypothetical protein